MSKKQKLSVSLVLFIDISFRFSSPSSHLRPFSNIHKHLFHAMHHLDWVHDIRNESFPLGTVIRIVACSRKFFLEFLFFPSSFYRTIGQFLFRPRVKKPYLQHQLLLVRQKASKAYVAPMLRRADVSWRADARRH